MKELNPGLLRHFERPQNTGIVINYNCKGKDSSMDSMVIVIFYALIKNGVIQDISFRTFGCSYSIAASSLITILAKKKDFFQAARIWKKDIEKELGIFPTFKREALYVALGAFHAMLSSYIPILSEEKQYNEIDNRIKEHFNLRNLYRTTKITYE